MRICTMCQASATHYCAQDDAFLCSDCNITIHSANALASRHKVVAITEAAQEQMVVADAHSEASATPCVVTEHPSVDVCLDASWTTSAGVVPVMDEDIPSLLLDGADFNQVPPLWDNNFDVFDMDNGWMGKLDDCLATDIPFPEAFNEAGLVPCLSPSFQDVFDDFAALDGFEVPAEPLEPKRMKMSEENDWSDLVVPSLHMPNVYPSPAQYSAPAPAPTPTPAASPTFQMPAPIVKVSPEQAALNRADRIALHREKKKSRTYEKTIRYASRKAYAEVRPRIKGRFATKEEVMAYKAAQAQGQVMSIEEWAAIMPTC